MWGSQDNSKMWRQHLKSIQTNINKGLTAKHKHTHTHIHTLTYTLIHSFFIQLFAVLLACWLAGLLARSISLHIVHTFILLNRWINRMKNNIILIEKQKGHLILLKRYFKHKYLISSDAFCRFSFILDCSARMVSYSPYCALYSLCFTYNIYIHSLTQTHTQTNKNFCVYFEQIISQENSNHAALLPL